MKFNKKNIIYHNWQCKKFYLNISYWYTTSFSTFKDKPTLKVNKKQLGSTQREIIHLTGTQNFPKN